MDWLTDLLENTADTLYCPAVETPLEALEALEEYLIEHTGRNLVNHIVKGE